jgi:hypothetical protein
MTYALEPGALLRRARIASGLSGFCGSHRSSGSERSATWRGSLSAPAVSDAAPLDPERIVTVLARHEVRYVLIGALAARLYGFPRVTADADITPRKDRENLERLADALRELEARVYTESVPEGLSFDCSAPTLERAELWNLVTAAGRIDVAFRPAGTRGYDDLSEHAVHFDVFGADVEAARLEDILRSKVAADRPKDRQDAVIIREMLRRAKP